MDEKLMMMEQDRLANEKKRKKNLKKVRIAAVVAVALVAVGIWYLGWGRHLGENEETTVQIVVSSGQEVVYADLTDVKGNEITYSVAKEAQEEAANEQEADSEPTGGDVPDMSQMPQRGERLENGEMPTGGDMPDMSQMPQRGEMLENGEMPTGGDMSDMSQMPQRGERSENGDMPQRDGMPGNGLTENVAETFTYNGVTYEVTEETVTTLIPVGTDVTTKLGTVTTFSRLAAGDKVALVVEEQSGEQIIVAVYIIE